MREYNQKGHIFINLGQFEDGNPSKNHADLKFFGVRNNKRNLKGPCVRAPHTIGVCEISREKC